MFASIKNKLSLLLVVLVLGFSILGYQIVQLTTLAEDTANRLVSIGEIDSEIKTFAMEIRGYQLYAKPKSLETYESSYKNIIESIDALLPILLSKENQLLLTELKKTCKHYM
jgi:methyl-accepting chemotaxis protein